MTMSKKNINTLVLFLALFICACAPAHEKTFTDDEFEKWELNSLTDLGGLQPKLLGTPELVEVDGIQAIKFNGSTDGLIIPRNPLSGLETFTVEVLFKPDYDGLPEQRFIHFQDTLLNRGLIETRVNPDSTWSLDTFLYNIEPESRLTLLDRNIVHRTNVWYWVALWYDGTTMKHFVNGVEELSGQVDFKPMTDGQLSIGVRLNQVHWFKGYISEMRFHHRALNKNELQSSCNCELSTYVISYAAQINKL
jgi:hypothetical protein